MMKRQVLTIAALVALAACGGGVEPVSGTILVTGQDYSYSGVPEVVASEAELTFTNGSSAEVHEMVIVKIADGESRTIEELVELPEAETESVVEFQGVLVGLPGEDGVNPDGPGASVTVTEPGRYGIVCFIPQGADPDVVAEAMAGGGEGPPEMGDGTPHAALGMVAEFEVE